MNTFSRTSLLFLFVLLTSCGRTAEDEILGFWHLVLQETADGKINYDNPESAICTFTFLEGNKMISDSPIRHILSTYVVVGEGDQIVVTPPVSGPAPNNLFTILKLTEDELVMSFLDNSKDTKLSFKRAGPDLEKDLVDQFGIE